MNEMTRSQQKMEIDSFFCRMERALNHPGIPESTVREVSRLLCDIAGRYVYINNHYRHVRVLYHDSGIAFIHACERLADVEELVETAADEYPGMRIYFNNVR